MIVCTATKTNAGKLTKVRAKRQPKLSIWFVMIGSLSISCCNLCTSLIWTTWDTPVKYILITSLPKAFPVFSPFKFSSCWSYSAYPLLMVLLLALSTFSCVHYFLSLSKYISPLPITPFTHPCFFCCPISFCSVSTVSSKKHFYVTGTRPWLLITMKLSTSFEIYSDYFYLLPLTRLFYC